MQSLDTVPRSVAADATAAPGAGLPPVPQGVMMTAPITLTGGTPKRKDAAASGARRTAGSAGLAAAAGAALAAVLLL